MTYKKRQMAQADWGIVGEEDEDGEAITAVQNQSKPRQQHRGQQQGQAPATMQQASPRRQIFAHVAQLKMQAMENGVKEEGINSWFEAKFGKVGMNRLADEQLQEVVEYLETMVRDSADRHLPEGNADEH